MPKREHAEIEDPLEPVHLKPSPSDTITIEKDDCTLVVWPNNKLPGTQLYRATCHTGACVVISKPHDDATKISEMLSSCEHPNLLKPIGIWEDPNVTGNSYLAFEEVHGCVKLMGKEIFSMEGSSIHAFSEIGFMLFRGIFSAINYVNERYQDAESTSSDTRHPLHALKLGDSTILYRITATNEVQAVLGDFHIKIPAALSNLKTSRRKPKDATSEDFQQYNWKSTGDYLSGLYKNYVVNEEIQHLANFLQSKMVKYDDLHWQPGVWEAEVKIEFIREVWWHVDRERDRRKTMKLEDTPKGKVLSDKPALGIISCIDKLLDGKHEKIYEKTLMDSVKHLRDHVVAHQDKSYLAYNGPKDDVGCTKASIERYVQKTKGDYMIQLIKQIRPLGWITQSPLLKDQDSYMDYFYEMKRADDLKEKEVQEKLQEEEKKNLK